MSQITTDPREVDAIVAAIRCSLPQAHLEEMSDDGTKESSDEASSDFADGGCSDEGNQDTSRSVWASPSDGYATRHHREVANGCFLDLGDDEASDGSADDECSEDDDDDFEDSDSEDSDSEEDDELPQMTRCRQRRRWRTSSEKWMHLRRLLMPVFQDWATIVYVHRDAQLQPPPELMMGKSITSPALLLGPPVDLSRAVTAPMRRRSATPPPVARRDSDDEAPSCWMNHGAHSANADTSSRSSQPHLAMQQSMLHEAAQKRTNQWCQQRLLSSLAARNKLRYGSAQDKRSGVDRSAVAEQANGFDAFYAKVAEMDVASESKLCFLRPQRSHSMDEW